MQAKLYPLSNLPSIPVIFREARKEDIKTIVELENQCFNQYQLKERNFNYLMRRGNCDFIVAEVDNKNIGYAISLYKKNSPDVRIYSIAINPDFRRINVGYNLLREIKQRAVMRGCRYIRLEVDSSNFVALRFYEKQGFKKYRTVRDYYGPNKHAIQYKKHLAL